MKGKRSAAKIPPGTCFKCERRVDGTQFCYGCGAYVCDDCDQRQYTGRVGPHVKEDHLIGDDDE